MTNEEYLTCRNDGSCPLIIDVREKEEWDTGHIDGAVHIPLAEIKEQIKLFAAKKDRRIVVCCAHGGRGLQAKKILQKKGYKQVENLERGYFGLL